MYKITNVLFLDDDENRHHEFKKIMDEVNEEAKLGVGTREEYDIVDTAEKAIEALKTDKYEVVFLDHDLGGKVYVNSSDKDTGAEVARWLKVNPTPISMIIVHTLNPDGSKNMLKELYDGDYSAHCLPFLLPGYHNAANYKLIVNHVWETCDLEEDGK